MNAEQAMNIVAEALGVQPLSAEYQAFGHNSVTYDVALPGRHVICRTNSDPQVFAATENNLAVLARLGLPVPKVLASDLTRNRVPFAYMIMNKIPGRDLRYELGAMTAGQMTRLAEQVAGFQRQVGRLPPGSGYGYVGIGEAGPHASWPELLDFEADRQTPSIHSEGIDAWQERVQRCWKRFDCYFHSVPATCFLDDITVKNVIVQNGELQGLVDFDCVCYGDPLYWLALTATGVVSDVGWRELFYVEELKRLWRLTPEQERVLALYSAAMSLDFLRRFSDGETLEWRTRMLAAVEQWVCAAEQDK